MKNTKNKNFTAVIKKTSKWYIGWIEEIPGANTQGKSLQEVRSNLKEALGLVLETNRLLSMQEKDSLPKQSFFRESISIQFA